MAKFYNKNEVSVKIEKQLNIIKCEKIGTFEICKVHKNDINKLLGGSNE